MLTDPQIERYARHVLLREVGGTGQERLLAARVVVAGLGPAGGWAAAYLALAGVGRLDLVDDRPVGPADLVPLLEAGDVGTRRDEAVARALPAWNPDVAAAPWPPRQAPAVGPARVGPEPLRPRDDDAAGHLPGAGPAPGPRDDDAGGHPGAGPSAPEDLPAPPPAVLVIADAAVAAPGWPDVPAVLALAAGDAGLVGPLDAGAPCPACAAAFLGDTPPAPAAATLAGSLAATRVLARLAAGAPGAGWFALDPGGLRSLDPASIPCPHRGGP